MANLNQFFNQILNDNRIYTREDIGEMSRNEFSKNEKAIDYQLANLGIPSNEQMSSSEDVVYVHAYKRDDGTEVKAHYRSKHGSINGIATGYASGMANDQNISQKKVKYTDKRNFGDDFQELLYTVMGTGMPITTNNMLNATHDMGMTKNNKNAMIINRNDIKSNQLNKLFDKVGIPKNSRGSVYNAQSLESVQLAQSKEINDFIDKNYNKLINGEIETALINFNFNFQKEKRDNFFGIQHATIYKPHIDKSGYFNSLIVDYYDFKKRNGFNPAHIPNNWGYSMQERGLLENQFNLYYIHKKIK